MYSSLEINTPPNVDKLSQTHKAQPTSTQTTDMTTSALIHHKRRHEGAKR